MAQARTSSNVDFPDPFSPTKNVTGESIDPDGLLGFETPTELAENINHLEKKNSTLAIGKAMLKKASKNNYHLMYLVN